MMDNDKNKSEDVFWDGYDSLRDLLYPETIYRLNQAMVALWKERNLDYLDENESKKIAWFVTPYFSAHSRTFHWVNVHPKLWADGKNEITSLLENLRTNIDKDSLDRFLADLPRGDFFSNAKRTINNLDKAEDRDNKRAALALYSGHHNPSDYNIEGIFFRVLRAIGNNYGSDNRLDFLEVTLSGDGCSLFSDIEHTSNIDDFITELALRECIQDSNVSLVAKQLYMALLGSQDNFQKELYARKHTALIPLYDHWRNRNGYGGIKAVLVAFFEDEEKRTLWRCQKFSTLAEGLANVSSEIAHSAQTQAINQPISAPYDLVSHFLKVLIYVQDWESATVIDSKTKKPLYQYRRKSEQDSIVSNWEKSAVSDPIQAFDSPNCIESHDGSMIMWWTHDLWSSDLIPGIRDDEISRFGHLEIRFEFPKASRIPETKGEREWLRHAYIRQQLRLMQQLIPKIQTRRAALRSAVSAIMGRNLSHNIGSHVLARYSSRITSDLEPTKPDPLTKERKTDHRSDFLTYLQRRMDFLAEIATSENAFWSQPLSLREQISRLNYKTQIERFKITDDIKWYDSGAWQQNAPILLSFITGKDKLLASVDYYGDDVLFSCPGGEVGIHALYVILENIIRNSARHGSTSSGMVRLKVKANGQDNGLIKLDIIDPGSSLKPDGRVTEDKHSYEDVVSETKFLASNNSHSRFDKNGVRQKLICLHNEINSILRDEPFLDNDGSPNPLFWGLREMQICAQYLRGMPLSELETAQPTPAVLEAGIHNINEDTACLKYTLYLESAKLMAAVIDVSDKNTKEIKALDRKGVRLISSSDANDLSKLAELSKGYSFLVFEGAEPRFLNNSAVCAALPARTLGGVKIIEETIKKACESNNPYWLDVLHQLWAEKYRDKRKKWKGKKIFGIAVMTNQALHGIPVWPDSNGGIGRARNCTDADKKALFEWAKQQLGIVGESLAAAWLDHSNVSSINTGGIGFGQAGTVATEDDPPRCWISAEVALSDSPHTAFLNSCTGNGWEILAAAIPRIAVLDERVQSEANCELRGGIQLHQAWPCMGVWVPSKDKCNLDIPVFDACRTFLEKPAAREDHFPIDFLVLHLTVLERLSKEKRLPLKETLAQLVEGTQASDAEIVIVTGRGVPNIANSLNHDHMEHVRYLPISALMESLIARPSKLALMRALWSAGGPF